MVAFTSHQLFINAPQITTAIQPASHPDIQTAIEELWPLFASKLEIFEANTWALWHDPCMHASCVSLWHRIVASMGLILRTYGLVRLIWPHFEWPCGFVASWRVAIGSAIIWANRISGHSCRKLVEMRQKPANHRYSRQWQCYESWVSSVVASFYPSSIARHQALMIKVTRWQERIKMSARW